MIGRSDVQLYDDILIQYMTGERERVRVRLLKMPRNCIFTDAVASTFERPAA